ncbi:MAG: prepilin peptidase [Suipraeoptans sp.]
MSIVSSVFWGVLIFIVIVITTKYYIPLLVKRTKQSTSDSTSESTSDLDTEDLEVISNNFNSDFNPRNRAFIATIILCTAFASWCGYVSGNNAVSIIGWVKMTLAFAVLACIFVTDWKLMIIPNLCSIILCIGRLITIVYELIWSRDMIKNSLINSILAMSIGLVFLIVLSKLTRGGIGMGDVKIITSLGFLCGIQAMVFTLLFSFLICTILTTVFLATKKKKLKDSIPLGPAIWVGFGISILLSIV